MAVKSKVVTVCGNTLFKADIIEIARQLTIDSYVVFTPSILFDTNNDEVIEDVLVGYYTKYINESDEVFIVNKGCILDNTLRKVIFASHSLNKNITFLEPVDMKSLDFLDTTSSWLKEHIYFFHNIVPYVIENFSLDMSASIIGSIVKHAVEGNKVAFNSYVELLISNLVKDGQDRQARIIRDSYTGDYKLRRKVVLDKIGRD